MNNQTRTASILLLAASFLLTVGCTNNGAPQTQIDVLVVNGDVFTGNDNSSQALDVAICGNTICGVYPSGDTKRKAKTIIDATGKIVSPGFIDPHTHTLQELYSKDKNHNLNYLSQGVTTVINGNDGGGPVDIAQAAKTLEANGIGTNVGLLVGHGSVREHVMGLAQRYANADELQAISDLLRAAMEAGALGFSSGLYYVPGSYANTEEVVTLAKIASEYNGIYDTHLRDEGTFNIGFSAALDEAIHIAQAADIHLHVAHIKALGVDVWGQSAAAIEKIEKAQAEGLSISADQYPWLASGTQLQSAVMPKWAMADSTEAFHQRLNNDAVAEQLRGEIKENIRRRGGPESLLITGFADSELVGLTLAQIAQKRDLDPVSTAIELVQEGSVRVASFNMSSSDVKAFMVRPWVVTSSDGTNGHPRKYASFSKKYEQYVKQEGVLSVGEFITQSSGKTAEILRIKDRGLLKVGFIADLIVIDPALYAAKADFSKWDSYSTGVQYVFVNGEMVISEFEYLDKLAGKFIR
jgi:N-acyl-D-aspartate/D-glutamate deacylase